MYFSPRRNEKILLSFLIYHDLPTQLDTYQTSGFCFDCVLRTLSLSRNVKLALLTGQEMFLCCGMKAIWIY